MLGTFARRVGRPISVSAVPVGPGIDIGRSVVILGVLSGFLFCYLGANHCPASAFGLGKVLAWSYFSAHGDVGSVFLDSLLEVFGYPVRSGGLLLAGELPLRYYYGNFALRKPSWSLPDYGGVQALLSAGGSGVGLVEFPAAVG